MAHNKLVSHTWYLSVKIGTKETLKQQASIWVYFAYAKVDS